jgi:hypothetical protein
MTSKQTFSLLLPFIAGSLHCMSVQYNTTNNPQKTKRDFITNDLLGPLLELDPIEYDTILKEYELENDAQVAKSPR